MTRIAIDYAMRADGEEHKFEFLSNEQNLFVVYHSKLLHHSIIEHLWFYL